MNILLLGLLALAAAHVTPRHRAGRRLVKKVLNETALKDLEEHLHVNLSKRWNRIKRLENKMSKRSNTTVREQKEIEQKLSELPEIETEKPDGEETVDLFERNELEGISEFLLQGDMQFTDEQLDVIEENLDTDANNSTRRKRQASTIFRKWAGNTLYYYFDSALSQRVRTSVTAALSYIQSNTCINFVQSSTAANRVKVYSGNGCFSNIGMIGGEQALSLGQGCEVISTAAHEFAHALGGFHTQMRYDRDSYVNVIPSAVQDGFLANNFAKLSSSESVNYNPYEYGSMMHYPATAFAKLPSNPTMIAKDSKYTFTMGGKLITYYDVKNINDHYGCASSCASSSTRCQNGGTPNPRNCATCICPLGYGGNLCDQRPSGCGETLTATSSWQSKQFTFGDANDSRNAKDVFTYCNHWISAPSGQKVVVKVTSMSNSQCNYGCPFNGMEIKLASNPQITNPRICCDSFLNQEFTSSLNPVPVVSFNRFYTTTFTIQYKLADGTSPPAPAPGPGPSPTTPGCTDNANCAIWINQGFCTNSFYSLEQRKQYCPNACNMCTAAPAPAGSSCIDTNTNCANFILNGFCSSPYYTTDQKKASCAKSCGLC